MTSLPDTRQSLLARIREPHDAQAWSDFVAVYEDAVYRYSRRRGLQDADAREVVQHVLWAVHQAVGQWQPTGRPGGFRAWLMQTARRACLKSLRERARRDPAVGGTSVLRQLQGVSDPGGDEPTEDADWRRWAFCFAAGQVQRDVEPATWQAFWLTAVEGLAPSETAIRLGMNVGSIYAAKCRVLARIRQCVDQLARSES